jgi:hypothetical protein
LKIATRQPATISTVRLKYQGMGRSLSMPFP